MVGILLLRIQIRQQLQLTSTVHDEPTVVAETASVDAVVVDYGDGCESEAVVDYYCGRMKKSLFDSVAVDAFE